jgi:hypothetical protein
MYHAAAARAPRARGKGSGAGGTVRGTGTGLARLGGCAQAPLQRLQLGPLQGVAGVAELAGHLGAPLGREHLGDAVGAERGDGGAGARLAAAAAVGDVAVGEQLEPLAGEGAQDLLGAGAARQGRRQRPAGERLPDGRHRGFVAAGEPLHEEAGHVAERLVAPRQDAEVEGGLDLLAGGEPAAQHVGERLAAPLHRAAVELAAAAVADDGEVAARPERADHGAGGVAREVDGRGAHVAAHVAVGVGVDEEAAERAVALELEVDATLRLLQGAGEGAGRQGLGEGAGGGGREAVEDARHARGVTDADEDGAQPAHRDEPPGESVDHARASSTAPPPPASPPLPPHPEQFRGPGGRRTDLEHPAGAPSMRKA